MVATQSSSDPLVVVIGATGLQGGSVIKALRASTNSYRIRALTRNVASDRATQLREQNIEVVACTVTTDSRSAIQNAFHGASYIFLVTNFWEHCDGEREAAEGIAMVEAAKAISVELLLISSLPNVTEITDGILTNVFHFDAKAAMIKRAQDIGVPYVEIQASGYMSNVTALDPPKARGDGTYVMKGQWSPKAKMPLIDTENDYGLFVQLAIESPVYNNGDGKIISAYSEWLSLREEAAIISRVCGKTVEYQQISETQSRKDMAADGLPLFLINDVVDMCKFHEFWWEKVFTFTDLSQLARTPRTFEAFCKAQDWAQLLQW